MNNEQKAKVQLCWKDFYIAVMGGNQEQAKKALATFQELWKKVADFSKGVSSPDATISLGLGDLKNVVDKTPFVPKEAYPWMKRIDQNMRILGIKVLS